MFFHSSHWVNFRSCVSGLYIILNSFWSRFESNSVPKLGKYRIIGFNFLNNPIDSLSPLWQGFDFHQLHKRFVSQFLYRGFSSCTPDKKKVFSNTILSFFCLDADEEMVQLHIWLRRSNGSENIRIGRVQQLYIKNIVKFCVFE